jgi:hypothetical protein
MAMRKRICAAAKAAGYKYVYNVKNGFEGPQNARGYRGSVARWKSEGLPWKWGLSSGAYHSPDTSQLFIISLNARG